MLNALAARAVPNEAWDAAPTPRLPNGPTLLQPRSPPAPKNQPQMVQEKSPKAHSSHKHGHLPSPTIGSAGGKWRELHMEDSGMVDTTLPISSSMFDGFCSPMGSFSDVTELLPLSITSTPLGQAGPRHGCTTSADSRHSSASCFTSLNFNIPGYPAVGLGSLTPSVSSIAGSHHVSSTWPPSLFTSGPSTPQLTIDQANSIFSLSVKHSTLNWPRSFMCCQDWRPRTATQSREQCMRH